jgi:hypothetical protein
VIQVSSPIQAQNSSGVEPDTAPIEVRGDPKSRKKDKLGVFAKLLEGLTGKAKNRGTEKNNHTVINETEETHLPSFRGKARGTAEKGKNNPPGLLNSRESPDSFDPLDSSNSLDSFDPLGGEETLYILGLWGQGEAAGGQNSALKTEFDPENAGSALKEPEAPAGGAGKTDESSFLKGRFPETGAIPREEPALEGGFPAGNTAKAEEAGPPSPILRKEDYPETKTAGRGVVDMIPASARNSGGKLYQFAGAPRPGLVDSLSGGTGETREGRLSEARKKGRDRLNSGLGSLKTGEIREAGVSETAKSSGFGGGAERIDLEIQAEIRADSSLKGPEGGADTGRESRSQGLENALVRDLRENLGADIVKQASILVRNQQEGAIRLTLKPETLGNIKIRLEMAENKITGHIVVESSEALKAFERELPVLEKAFRDSGFSEANLNMSMAWDGGSYGQEQYGGDSRNFSPALAASRYDAGIVERELVPQGFFPETSGKKAVNLLV